MFEALRGLGYAGGYDTVRRYASGWQLSRPSAPVSRLVRRVGTGQRDHARYLRWSPSVGQFDGLVKLGPGCRQAANLIVSLAGAAPQSRKRL